ncbi:hypothetical protein HZ326_22197 [Fusarium oxysporum f. sp. albedinis]|nr:hypothetical protein HZ326_22197 [Fusarium oxysporum f. sp. albedinis]
MTCQLPSRYGMLLENRRSYLPTYITRYFSLSLSIITNKFFLSLARHISTSAAITSTIPTSLSSRISVPAHAPFLGISAKR